MELTTATINDPTRAGKKPATEKPSIKEAANQNRSALMIKINKPNVIRVIGSVRITSIGFTMRLRRPRTNAAIRAAYIFSTAMPGTKYATPIRVKAVITMRIIIFIPILYQKYVLSLPPHVSRVTLDTCGTVNGMERKISFVGGEYYHLYNRGVEKRTIFTSADDYCRFMMLLYLANSDTNVHMSNVLKHTMYEDIFVRERGKPKIAIGAFCLMPNHFHILATPLSKNGLSSFMLTLQTAYSMYFNTKNERAGSLFQGPFRAEHAADDAYLKYLYSYIHLNPAKLVDSNWKEHIGSHPKKLRAYVESYPYSSLREYLSGAHAITDPAQFPDYFSSKEVLFAHLSDWLETYQG